MSLLMHGFVAETKVAGHLMEYDCEPKVSSDADFAKGAQAIRRVCWQ
jgi:hypothetical protein